MPHFKVEISAAKMAELQSLFENPTVALIHICTKHEVSYYQLQKLSKSQNWKSRPPSRRAAVRLSKQAKSNGNMLKRMQVIAKRHVESLERALDNSDTTTSSSDRDRDARTLRTLIKIIEEINLLSKDMKANKERNSRCGGWIQRRVANVVIDHCRLGRVGRVGWQGAILKFFPII